MASTHPEIGKKILRLRTQRGLSQRELAQKAGFGVNSWGLIKRWEKREADPSFGQTRKLANALGVPFDWLWGPDPLPANYEQTLPK